MGSVIGKVVAKGEGRWEWIIPHFSALLRMTNVYLSSPNFDAEGVRWYLRIYPNGTTSGETQISFTLKRTSSHGRSLTCKMGVKRADHSEQTIGTEKCGGRIDPSFVFNKTRRELENGGWLLDDQLTVTLLFRRAHAPQGYNISMLRDIKTEHSKSAIDQDSRRDVNKPPEAKGNRKVTFRETETGKNERLEAGTCTGDEGVMQLSENLKALLTKENEDYDVRIFVKGKEFHAHQCILKVRSSVLGRMLKHDSGEKHSGTIDVEDCDPDCFGAFLLFVYSGRTEDLTTSKALSLYYAADKYDLPLLKKKCVHFLMEASLSAASACDVVQLATKHGEEGLLQTATEFFKKNIKQILSTVEWQNFMVENPTVANELLLKAL